MVGWEEVARGTFVSVWIINMCFTLIMLFHCIHVAYVHEASSNVRPSGDGGLELTIGGEEL